MYINKQQPAVYSFIVFRYVFIVQQFADAPAVHFAEVCAEGFVICTNIFYVIPLLHLVACFPQQRQKKSVPQVTNGLSLNELACSSSL